MDLNPRYILGRLREIEREIDYLEVDQNLAQSFEALARFRNRLVHRYWTVDDRVFLENLRRGLHEFRDFVSLMEREVQKARG